jgi:hypothetical protein
MVDANSNLKNSDFQKVMKGLPLKEAIMDRHCKSGPSTFCRNKFATPVDGIWISPGLRFSAGGYFPYDIPIPNMEHRCAWIGVLHRGTKLPIKKSKLGRNGCIREYGAFPILLCLPTANRRF